MKNYLLLSLLGVLLFSCNPNRVLNEHSNVKTPLKWQRSDIKIYEFNVEETKEKYNIAVALRHHSSMNRANIKIKLSITTPDGKSTTGNYILPIRDANGNLLGEAAGDLCDTENFIINEFEFKNKGIHKFTVEHSEKDDDLALIMEVGLIIDKLAKE